MTHMERALALGRRALGSVSPNPAVGAVVVKDGVPVGEGWTQPPGQPHAEVMALRQASERARGAVLYTTLEPCVHTGRTPPCTEAIVQAGIAEVRAALLDPNPRVDGKGISRLDLAGVATHVGEGQTEAGVLIEAFRKFITTGLPFVTAKFAMSLDGKIATRSGDSQWITGEEARAHAHILRATSDAVVVGINTALADNPQLTARDPEGRPLGRQPLRVVVDGKGRLPSSARMLGQPGDTLIAVAGDTQRARTELAAGSVTVESLPGPCGDVDLAALLVLLGRRDVTSVLVEGGGTLLGSLFDAALVDKVVAFVAPVVIGGRTALSAVSGEGVERVADAVGLDDVVVERFGRDLAITGYCGR